MILTILCPHPLRSLAHMHAHHHVCLHAACVQVKISNLHRVLGLESAADPTAIEREVRKQMAERAAAHEDRNLARKLTPAEAREKKMRQMFDDSAVETLTVVYKVWCAPFLRCRCVHEC